MRRESEIHFNTIIRSQMALNVRVTGCDLPRESAEDTEDFSKVTAQPRALRGAMSLRISIPLGRGTLKIKSYGMLRTDELERRVPVKRIGGTYLIWRSNRKTKKRRPQSPGGASTPLHPR